MNWYKLDVVRDVLRRDYGAYVPPSAIGRPNVEVWARKVGGHTYATALSYKNVELLVSEDALLEAAEALNLSVRAFLDAVKARGGLWTGPSPL